MSISILCTVESFLLSYHRRVFNRTVSHRKLHHAGLLVLLVSLPGIGAVHALDLGFEGLLSLESSDNIAGVNSPDEEDGQTAGALLGVYGEQRSRIVQAAFSGEIDTRRVISEEDSSFNTVTRFLGAAEFALTPRSWRWYVGDILGGVRNDNAVQTIDDTEIDRRNVFVTGPSFEYDVEGISRTRARALYVNQTEEDEVIESLYTFNFSHERETTPGSYYGLRLGDVYTDVPEDSDTVQAANGDFNRSSISVFGNRLRGFLELYGELGVTRYDTEDESLNGLNAELRATRTLGPQTAFTARLTRNLNDQTLSTVESLISGGGETVGLRPEIAGFFADTELTLEYSFQSSVNSIDVGVGVSELDYQLLASDPSLSLSADGEDQMQAFAFGSWSTRLSTRLRGELGVRYERQEYDNRRDETESVLAGAQLVYRLSRSFELEGSVVHDSATGLLTRFSTGVGVEQDIDVTENRVTIGLRWAPPSRASRDLTVELKSLLQ